MTFKKPSTFRTSSLKIVNYKLHKTKEVNNLYAFIYNSICPIELQFGYYAVVFGSVTADCILCEIFQESQLGDTLCTFPFPSRVAPYLRQRLEIDRLNRRRSATCKTGRIKFPMPSPIHQPQNTIQYHTNAKNTDSICFFTFS